MRTTPATCTSCAMTSPCTPPLSSRTSAMSPTTWVRPTPQFGVEKEQNGAWGCHWVGDRVSLLLSYSPLCARSAAESPRCRQTRPQEAQAGAERRCQAPPRRDSECGMDPPCVPPCVPSLSPLPLGGSNPDCFFLLASPAAPATRCRASSTPVTVPSVLLRHPPDPPNCPGGTGAASQPPQVTGGVSAPPPSPIKVSPGCSVLCCCRLRDTTRRAKVPGRRPPPLSGRYHPPRLRWGHKWGQSHSGG